MAFARAYFAFQGLAGAVWWLLIFEGSALRPITLGGLPLEIAWFDVPLFVGASMLAALGWRPAVWTALIWTAFVTAGLAVQATLTREAGWGAMSMAAALAGTVVASAWILFGRIPTEWLIQGPFVFRTTTDENGHLARTWRQLVAFWITFLLILPSALRGLERRWQLDGEFSLPLRVCGGVLFLAMSALGIASSLVMARCGEGTPLPSTMAKRLVVAGPYRFVRNPMAVAGIGQGLAVGLMMGSWMVVAYAVVGSLLWNGAIRPHEEADLESRFGAEFEQYRQKVSCWWPKRYDPPTS